MKENVSKCSAFFFRNLMKRLTNGRFTVYNIQIYIIFQTCIKRTCKHIKFVNDTKYLSSFDWLKRSDLCQRKRRSCHRQ